MTQPNHQLIRDFFAALSSGDLPEALITPDMLAWTPTSGDTSKEAFQFGVKMLGKIFNGTLTYTIDALTAEEDRVAAEVQSRGTLSNGEDFHNRHVFTFRVRDGRVASVAEFMNQFIVRDKIMPLFQAEMAKAG